MQAGRLRFASRRKGLQAAEVHRVDGHVGLHRRGGGRAQRGLIVRPGLADSVAEINEALLLRELAERLHQRLQRQQFAVGAKGVVIGVISRERTPGFRCSFGASSVSIVESLAFAGGVPGKRGRDFGLVFREVQIHAHICG